jgi:hypothetical protein
MVSVKAARIKKSLKYGQRPKTSFAMAKERYTADPSTYSR